MSEKNIHAIILMHPASGPYHSPPEGITSQNIEKLAPPESVVDKVRGYLVKRGIRVMPIVGLGFGISGTAECFRQVFGLDVFVEEAGGFWRKKNGELVRELPHNQLPVEMQPYIDTVAFEEPVKLF